MKNTWRSVLLIVISAAVVLSCKEKDKPSGDDTPAGGEIGTLSGLLEKVGSNSENFDFTISNLVVTAVYENYAQLEDATCGAQLNKAGHGLQVGQKIDGRISGKARNTSGALNLSELNTSAAKISQAPSLPETKVSLAEVLADKAKYTNRRVQLENVTFVNGFNGTAGGAGIFSQKGVQITSTCRPSGIVIPDGWQGDLVCFPSAAACYIFSADDFSEHAINTPLAAVSNFGIYKNAATSPLALRSYQAGKDQYAWSNDAECEFRLQNYDEEWVLRFRYPKKYKLGQELTLNTETIGLTGIVEGESKVFVEKIQNGKIWLMDYDADLGYVFQISEEE